MTDTRTRWLDDSEQRAWRAYLRMQGRLTARLGRQLQSDSDLSLADFEVLVLLTDIPDGRLRVLRLAQELQWEKSRMSHHIGRMEKRGLITRQECPEDGRGAFVVITPAGRTAIAAAAPQHVETVRKYVFDQLSEEQVTALGAISERVLDALDADC